MKSALAVRARFRSLRQTPVERGDSLPEQGRRRAFPRLPLIDDGLPRRAHQRGQLRLAQPACATQRANLHCVVVGHTGPGRRLSPVSWPNLSAVIGTAKLRGGRERCLRSEPSKGGPGVIGHRQPPVPRRHPQRLDVHPDQEREYGKGQERLLIAMRRQHPCPCEDLRRRCPPPGIPRPIRFGGHAEHRRERRLRLTQRDPALTQRAGLHDVTPCHRRRPPGSAGVARAYFSQPIFEPDRSLCSLHPRRGSRESGHTRRILAESGAPGRTRTCDPRLRRPHV